MATTTIPYKTTYLIVGAGPAGLAVHATLLNNGIGEDLVLHIEKHPQMRPREMSRAAGMHARTLEVLEEAIDAPETVAALPAGVRTRKAAEPRDPYAPMPERVESITELLLEHGVQIQSASMRRTGRAAPLLKQEFSGLDTKYPYVNCLSQTVTEEALARRVETLGGVIHRGWTLEDINIHDDGDHVAKVKGPDGNSVQVQAKYIIGADGGNSLTRRTAGLTFEGGTYPQTFVLSDVRLKDISWPWNDAELGFHGQEMSVFMTTEGALILVPLPGNRIRVVGTVAPPPEKSAVAQQASDGGHVEDRVPPTQEESQALINNRILGGKSGRSEIDHVFWTSKFYVHHRVTSSFRHGRILLVGDAAHVHSPAGGQGMNTGIQDGVSLALVLVKLAKDGTDKAGEEAALNAWATKRLEIVRKVVNMTDTMTKVMTTTDTKMVWLRDTALQVAGWVPGLPKMAAYQMSELGNR